MSGSIALVMGLAVLLIVWLIRRKVPVGAATLSGGLLIWAFTSRDPGVLAASLEKTALSPRTWDLMGALLAVMAIESELKGAQSIRGMVAALEKTFHSPKATLFLMPAFLGLLPSVGGARFSAPIVDEASQGLGLSAEQKSAVNFWFRHIFENLRPIAPGVILAASIARVDIGELIASLLWTGAVFAAAGWLVLLRSVKARARSSGAPSGSGLEAAREVFLAVLPIAASFVLMFATNLGAGRSIGLVAGGMIPVLLAFGKPVDLRSILKNTFEWPLFLNTFAILLFVELAGESGALEQLAAAILSAPMPAPVLLGAAAFVLGAVVGMTPGYVGIVMPLAAALVPQGSLELAGVILSCGLAGIMLTPTHMCLTVTLDYFRADYLKTLPLLARCSALYLLCYIAGACLLQLLW
ncbi:MAG: DUF401 family protein [Mesosutterella sp.]|uniref:DUF401 family protein n=1 Tax=Mesosutterella faecium TaxID=2925194 RepID=A0ABT7IPT9_9BURK|nr:DUF401 family protein [Mesosutterella sp. AGMB02718]MCI6531051.1 DUF401 family protein [Mesosutterella sp.]MDL2060410.1 DUF401 family protein [Mesosutterella sp. AGMB02718]